MAEVKITTYPTSYDCEIGDFSLEVYPTEGKIHLSHLTEDMGYQEFKMEDFKTLIKYFSTLPHFLD